MANATMNVKCTYEDCNEYFDTVQDMKYHKVINEEHEYCYECDYDAANWEELVAHKGAVMRTWLNSGKRSKLPKKHIVCETCGDCFGCMAGRDRHITQQHPPERTVVCKCKKTFGGAGELVRHIEKGKCTVVTLSKFQHLLKQKHAANLLQGDSPTSLLDAPPKGDLVTNLQGLTINDNDSTTSNHFFWDTSSSEYDVEVFRLSGDDHYRCPFLTCGDAFEIDYMLTNHIDAHFEFQHRCPTCNRIYGTTSALVSHIESRGDCTVKKRTDFEKRIEDITGGLVCADDVR